MKKSPWIYLSIILLLVAFWLGMANKCSAQVTPATFPDPFDSLSFIGDGKVDGKFAQFTGTTNVLPFTVTFNTGRFMVNLYSKRYLNPKLTEFKRQWQVRDSVTIAKGVVSVLNKNVFTRQARILIPVAATTTTPSVNIKQGTTVVANVAMRQLSGYWYIYINTALLTNRTIDIYGFSSTGAFQLKKPVAGESVVLNVTISSIDSTKILFTPK